MINFTHAAIIILLMGLITAATRFLPEIIFGRKEQVPDCIVYLGKVVPYAAMGLLVVYCLRDTPVMGPSHGLHEAAAMAVVIGSYLWRRNTTLSVVLGTAAYMLLVQYI